MLQNFEERNAEFLELLSFCNCYKKLTKKNLSIVLLELVHQEIVQKPRYIANCFMEAMTASKLIFDTTEQLEEFYQNRLPTVKKVINALKCDVESSIQSFNTLHKVLE